MMLKLETGTYQVLPPGTPFSEVEALLERVLLRGDWFLQKTKSEGWAVCRLCMVVGGGPGRPGIPASVVRVSRWAGRTCADVGMFPHGEAQCSPGKGGGNFQVWLRFLVSCPLDNQEGNHPV